ncbi:putative lipoprotein [Labilithrix luteola]|uniref:Putative lipoprotein n=1 Tax=Labilithrix luteola TaxID=1391654 RepID=A0A0K1PRL0_9BACT|nr:DUF3829 domain-containing protein [Labilithrix luteola]AKU96185.1 putative lipoprotein [Labilithrix luteola]
MRKFVSGPLSKLALAGALVGVVLSGTGCKKLLKKATQFDAGVTAPEASSATAQAEDPDDALQEKLEEYIKCLNTLSSSVHQSQKRYLSLVPKNGPTGKESWADIYKLPDGAAGKCAAGVEKSKAMPPKDASTAALETAGESFAKAVNILDPMITDLDKYFDNKDFRDDKWAKAKTVHPQLMQAFADFNKADNALHTALDGITKPLAQRVLATIEKEEGKKFRYHRKHVLNTARELIEASDPSGEDANVDFNLYSASLTEFEKAVDDLTTYGGAHKAELGDRKLAPAWPLADSHYSSFVSSVTAYRKASKDYWRCLRDAPAKAKTPTGKVDLDKVTTCPDGRPGQVAEEVVKKYNEFIRTSNNNQFP